MREPGVIDLVAVGSRATQRIDVPVNSQFRCGFLRFDLTVFVGFAEAAVIRVAQFRLARVASRGPHGPRVD